MNVLTNASHLVIESSEKQLYVRLTCSQYHESMLSILSIYKQFQKDENGLLLSYSLVNKGISLSQYKDTTSSLLDKLKISEKMVELLFSPSDFIIPYISPDNLYIDDDRVTMVHTGLKNMLFPFYYHEKNSLKDIKAAILLLFHPTIDFYQLRLGILALEDYFSTRFQSCQTLVELMNCLREERKKEQERISKTKQLVSKKHYIMYRVVSIASTVWVCLLLVTCYVYYMQYKKQEDVIEAQTYFLTNHYDKVQKQLEKYVPNELPMLTQYSLAVSSIELTDLTRQQKHVIISQLSLKSNENTLYYWIYTGRGQFEKALDLSKNLGDEQLMLLAYTNLYHFVQLDEKMDGNLKQKKLEEYANEIDKLSKLFNTLEKEE